MPDVGLLVPGADLGPGSPAAVTDDIAVLRWLLAVEVAWIRAQAAVGMTSATAAAAIGDVISSLAADDATALALATGIAAEAAGGGNPVIPMLARIRSALAAADLPDSGLHAGLTSQDVLDTALVLVLRETGRNAVADLDRVVAGLARLAVTHRSEPAVGRTLTQAAAPTTLGARFAAWLHGVAAARVALAAAGHALPIAYGGAAGTLAGTAVLAADGDPFPLVEAWAGELGLPIPPGPWHVVRTPILRWAGAAAEAVAALGTLAADVLLGSRPEIAELREPAAAGRGVSSVMPHKRNPVLSLLIRRSALITPLLAAQVISAAGQAVDQRPDGAWHAEWPALQQLARHTVAAAGLAAELVEGLEVDPQAAARHLVDQLGVEPGDADIGVATAIVDRVLAWAAGGRVEDEP